MALDERAQKIRQEILDATREGRLADWTERISVIAWLAGFKLEDFNWNQSASMVIIRLLDACGRPGYPEMGALEPAIKKYVEQSARNSFDAIPR